MVEEALAEGKRVRIFFEISEDLLREEIGIAYALDRFKHQLTEWLDSHPEGAES